MKKLLILALIGFFAQLVDGALGMAYGVTSTSLLLFFGIAPAIASASVHMAEVVTTAASGISHWKFGNVDRVIVKRLMVPGALGAFVGACFLSNIPGDLARPFISAFLFLLGFYVLYRFLFVKQVPLMKKKKPGKWTIPLGLFAGFADSTGGGGWGPLTTPILISHKGMEPRKVIGSVDTSEFAVAVAASLGFLIALGPSQIDWTWVGALMLGGVLAAPIAAWCVKWIPPQLLGVLVGGFIIVINTRTILDSTGWVPPSFYPWVYAWLIFLWTLALGAAIQKIRTGRHCKQSSDSDH
ncbi:sulfite exporter TauE/SafE family protein [Desmospora profundinema]|uniref:Probable membrane transporter protein n=1 Tax=Desmospora profundinema TaxID=1571184 RepID=A0ABU1IMC2_9BACL|nr:sulfite exporter TauE/SafE family protein [Desmospora profundinema]MDR6225846.1 putative membrane protein YfcA [Desmospora profundinema]